MSTYDENTPVIIFDGTYLDAAIVKSMLDDSNIECYMKDELMGVIAPWNVAGGGAGSVSLVVAKHDVALAQQIVLEFEKRRQDD